MLGEGAGDLVGDSVAVGVADKDGEAVGSGDGEPVIVLVFVTVLEREDLDGVRVGVRDVEMDLVMERDSDAGERVDVGVLD